MGPTHCSLIEDVSAFQIKVVKIDVPVPVLVHVPHHPQHLVRRHLLRPGVLDEVAVELRRRDYTVLLGIQMGKQLLRQRLRRRELLVPQEPLLHSVQKVPQLHVVQHPTGRCVVLVGARAVQQRVHPHRLYQGERLHQDQQHLQHEQAHTAGHPPEPTGVHQKRPGSVKQERQVHPREEDQQLDHKRHEVLTGLRPHVMFKDGQPPGVGGRHFRIQRFIQRTRGAPGARSVAEPG
eukprot:CAMPEP_0174292554 /NCGR_PEP_ID=MMETSP0809-20121228/35847_1 /TAXON_ID=73025 ORGANISM="Eutreptiella gymnastica-like, Strain CCMP1594" /NCGR_SAMPLE_ID=MMETSP0809 /ASSEMBLY_ACC=CAM_ASM_000658 /LENGTH=234 /DNA_ID=CAMNT_0015392705 /DNA_START=227 /DNA_END=927 /DNA_ORIENTATION=+